MSLKGYENDCGFKRSTVFLRLYFLKAILDS